MADVTDAEPAGSLHEIGVDVHAWLQPDGTWWINNAGAISGDWGTVIVDTCATERRTRAFLRAVAAATGEAPVRLAVSTHQHGDHTHGNSLLPADTVIVAHEATRAGQLADPVIDGCPPFWSPVPDWGRVTRRVADVVLRSDLTIHAGERLVELRHPGYAAHTAGDVVAWLPEERILFAGDLLFHSLTPLVFMGSVDGALRSLDWIAAFDPALVVPGHGPLADRGMLPRVLAEHERYYRLILAVAQEGLRDGIGPLEAARRADLGEFGAWADAERLVLNLHRAYADATSTGLDIVAAFTDAVSWHGGSLPTSV
jgi:cyclase